MSPSSFCKCKGYLFEFFSAGHKFASAGREDVDVRMLGRGKLAVRTDCGRVRKAVFVVVAVVVSAELFIRPKVIQTTAIRCKHQC